MKYLVTGGAGFIGSHVVESLLADGAHVTVLDNLDPFYSRALKVDNLNRAQSNAQFRMVEGDICNVGDLRALEGSFDCIVHLAGKAGVRPSISEPLSYQHVNVIGTQNLLEFARVCEIPQFVFASSSSVYGTNPNIPWRESDHVLRPISPYASTKVSGELLGHVYSHLYGMRFVALRFFTVYGPRQRPDLAIRKFAEMILAGEPIPVFGDGQTRRDYTYIDDIVGGIRAAMEYSASPYEVINLGNSRTVTLLEMVQAIEDALHRKALRQSLPEQPGDLACTCADVTKARKLLNYQPKVSFEEGIDRFVEWLLAAAPADAAHLTTKLN